MFGCRLWGTCPMFDVWLQAMRYLSYVWCLVAGYEVPVLCLMFGCRLCGTCPMFDVWLQAMRYLSYVWCLVAGYAVPLLCLMFGCRLCGTCPMFDVWLQAMRYLSYVWCLVAGYAVPVLCLMFGCRLCGTCSMFDVWLQAMWYLSYVWCLVAGYAVPVLRAVSTVYWRGRLLPPLCAAQELVLVGHTESSEWYDQSFFSSPEHKVLMVSYCDRPLSVVRRRPSSIVRKRFYLNISSETAHLIFTKLHWNDPWVVPYLSGSNCSSWLHK